MELITVYSCFNIASADLMVSHLQAMGFDTVLLHDTAALSMEGYSFATGGVKVQVPAAQAEAARLLALEFEKPSS